VKILKFIPNLFTLANLFVGCLAVVYGLRGDLNTLAIFVSIGLLFDFFDGFFARLLKVDSKIGVQLDSLSDLVTFGLTSSIVLMYLINNSTLVLENDSNFYNHIFVLAFVVTLASSYRLAKFNIGDRNHEFNGLPTPANAIFIVFLPFFMEKFKLLGLFDNLYFLIFLVFFSSYMLVSNHSMISLKLKYSNFDKNKLLLLILLSSIVLIILYGLASFPIIIIIYILVNILRSVL